jgi:serine/threonine-protein kinase HipA
MSLAGAQHKLAIVLRDEELFEPVGAKPSTHILKPDSVDPDYPHTAVNEYFTMRLAGTLKVGVPNTLRRYVPSPIYVVERFDRKTKGTDVERLHLIDACQALNLDRQFKYREGHVGRLRELAEKCTPAAIARINLFRWLVFNMLVGNSDAHLKNISFLVDAAGLRLAPFYDLLAVGVYGTQTFGKKEWPHMPLAFPVEDAKTFHEVSRETLIEAGKSLGLRADTAARILSEVTDRIDPAARGLLAEIEEENRKLSNGPAGKILGGELRCLRAIVEIVIRDSVPKLKKTTLQVPS